MKADHIELAVDEKYHNEICIMLCKHEAKLTEEPGKTRIAEHRRDLVQDARPFKLPPYLIAPKRTELELFQVQKQLKDEVINPAVWEWAARVPLALKKNGKLRLCNDCRKLNQVSVEDHYPLPRMDECIESRDAKVFTTIDAYAGY